MFAALSFACWAAAWTAGEFALQAFIGGHWLIQFSLGTLFTWSTTTIWAGTFSA
jgi:hypothetical protein